jgi:hypothetical protein
MEAKNVPDEMAERLLGLHNSPFTIWQEPTPEEKALDHAPEDKMMRGAPAIKASNEFEQVFMGGEIEKPKAEQAAAPEAVEESPAESIAPTAGQDNEPVQEKGESNSHFKKRLKAYKEKRK